MSDLGNKKIMAENLLHYMSEKGVSRMDLCRALSLKYTTLTGWLTAEKYPRIDKIEVMANYFGVSKADLVEKRSVPNEDRPYSELHNLVDALPASKLDEAKSYLDYLKSKSDNS